ncbi:MAG: Flp pilus assembly protein TadB [Gammaproteobacteria bacterium]|jgi:Flp pilus assembly protein TadB
MHQDSYQERQAADREQRGPPHVPGVTWGFKWARFLSVCLLGSGLAFLVSLLTANVLVLPFAVIFGATLISLSILEASSKFNGLR